MGGKGGCKVVPRNFLSVLKHYIQISITIASPLSHLTSPSPRLPSSVSHPHPPPPPPPPQKLPHTHTHFPHAPIHLISSHPIPSHPINTQTQLHTLCSPPPILSLIFYLLHTHPTLHLCPNTLSSIDSSRLISILRLIFPHISRSCTRSRSLAWCAISVVRVAWVGRFGGGT